MTTKFFVQLIDVMTALSSINVTTLDASTKTFNCLLKAARNKYNLNFEREMATNGISSSISFRSWLNDEETLNKLKNYEQGRKIVDKIMKARAKYESEQL
jgi:hypothetical protein